MNRTETGMSGSKYAATPLSRKAIANYAFQLRKLAGLESFMNFDIVRFIENILPDLYPNFQFEIANNNDLIKKYAETIPAYLGRPAII